MELHINESKKNPGALLYDPLTKESLYRIKNSHKHTLVTRTRPNPTGGTGTTTGTEEEEEKVADIEWAVLGTTRLTSSVVGDCDGKAVPVKRIIESKRLGRYVYICCSARNGQSDGVVHAKVVHRHYVFSGPDGRSYRWKEKTTGGYNVSLCLTSMMAPSTARTL